MVVKETELWSVDSGESRSIKATIRPSRSYPGFVELNLRWSDGEPVEFPVPLSNPDLVNLVDLLQATTTEP